MSLNRFPPPPFKPPLNPGCAYCGRSARPDVHGNCSGCGAELRPRRPVVPQPRPVAR